MKKILLTHSYFLNLDSKQLKAGLPYPPLATLYAASTLERAGYPVTVCDVQLASGTEVIDAYLQHRPNYFVLYDDGFNYLTKMCLSNMRTAAFEMLAKAKASGCTIIVSSSDATDNLNAYFNAGADFIIIGEAEKTLVELLAALHSNGDTLNVPGLAFQKDGAIVRTRARAAIRDLDELPPPAWHLIDLQPYRLLWLRNAGYFSINISTTRGCPFKCNWCAKPIYGNRYSSRTPESVVAELVQLQSEIGFDHVWFTDDIFGLKPGWVEQFASCCAEKGLKFRYKIQNRADLLLQSNYVSALASSGCEQVWMGAESGSQRILDAMDKGITVKQIEKATLLLRKFAIKPCFFIQFGYSGETKGDIEATVSMIRKLMPDDIGISVSYPLPGTVFYRNVKADLSNKQNWTDSNEMALMFRNTFQPAFYKKLHRYVHYQFRIEKGRHAFRKTFLSPRSLRWSDLRMAIYGLLIIPRKVLLQRNLKHLAHE